MGIYLEQRSGKALYLNTDEILMADYYPKESDSPSQLNIFFKREGGMKTFIGRQADVLINCLRNGWEVDVIGDWEVGVIRESDYFDGSDVALCDPEPELSNPL